MEEMGETVQTCQLTQSLGQDLNLLPPDYGAWLLSLICVWPISLLRGGITCDRYYSMPSCNLALFHFGLF